MRGKSWSVEEERQLRQLVLERKSLEEISKTMGKTRVAVKAKLFNLGLNFLRDATPSAKQTVASAAAVSSTEAPVFVPAPSAVVALPVNVDLELPQRLPSVEEELKVLSGAMKALEEPGLCRAEVLRLHSIIQGVKIYQELYAKYVDYRGLEAEVLELRKQLATENSKGTREESANVSR